jgi:23S rRNA (cytosine1962-C5)-methyltransferase
MIDALLRATARRVPPPGTDVLRLVDDAADECPHVLVDRYGPVLRIELYLEAWPTWLDAAVRALVDVTGATGVVGLLRVGRGLVQARVLHGVVPKAHVVHERSMRLLVRTDDEDAPGTGVFVDQREGRKLVRAHARGRNVLNLFAHAGAFGVAAVVGGAARVDHVDAARKCAPWAACNLALNGADPRAHRFLVDDALKVLQKSARKGGGYGVIVCDPPTTALRPDGRRFVVGRHLHELARDAALALDDGGHLLLSCNDRALSVQAVSEAAAQGVHEAGRRALDVVEVPLPDDVPTRDDVQLRPMRGVWLTVR